MKRCNIDTVITFAAVRRGETALKVAHIYPLVVWYREHKGIEFTFNDFFLVDLEERARGNDLQSTPDDMLHSRRGESHKKVNRIDEENYIEIPTLEKLIEQGKIKEAIDVFKQKHRTKGTLLSSRFSQLEDD